ncbi:hypothetical protein C8R45DRAFT_1133083 [Mycena sanguinolenta]|nr:hypothetical protein C8R45DRAFT_1133083 [Mycena sanguinolenta]
MHQSLRLGILSSLERRKYATATAAVNGLLPPLRIMVQEAATNPEEKRILPLFYHHLNQNKIPSEDVMDTEILGTDTVDTITRALLCLEGFYNLSAFPPGSHPEIWGRVWPWAQFLDVHRSRITGAPTQDMLRAHVFGIIVGLGGISGEMASTPEIAVLVAQVWGTYFRDPNPTSEKALRGVAMFHTWGGQCGLDPFVEGAGSIEALAILVVKLIQYLLNTNVTPSLVIRTLTGIIMFSKCSSDDVWLSALRAHKFMAAMISVLLFIERHIDSEAPTDDGLYRGLFKLAWQGFFRLSALNPSYTGVVEAVDAGILQAIALMFVRNLDWTETIIQEMIKSIVQPATVYYPVLAALERALPLIEQTLHASASNSSALCADWKKFLSIVLNRLGLKRKFDSREHLSRKACDNLEVNLFNVDPASDISFESSVECQINDWRTDHRKSCTRRPESPAHLTNRDTAFLRFLVAHDYERHKQSIFLARIVQMHHHGEEILTFFDYDTGGVQIDVRPLPIGNRGSDYYARVRRSARRIHPIRVQVTTGEAYFQQWVLSIRSSVSEVHDALFQLSQGLPPGTDALSDLSPAVHRAVAELIETVCPEVEEIVVA